MSLDPNISVSFEFFPPKTQEQKVVLASTREQLSEIGPEYFSITFGAGGSTIDHTRETVYAIHADKKVPVAPHLSCVGGSRDSIGAMLRDYRDAGIDRIVALRGDIPSGMAALGYFRHANELVEFIRMETGDHFAISVACYPEVHPEAESARNDIKHFKDKIDAGANNAITQYFFNADAYYNFVDLAQSNGIDIPIVPGIMPISNYTQLARFSEMCGTDMPRWLRRRLQDFGDDRASIQAFGRDVITRLCTNLLEQGVPGLHFYTLNRAKATTDIIQDLGIRQ